MAKLDLVVEDCAASICLVGSSIMSSLRFGGTKFRIPFISSDEFESFRPSDATDGWVQSLLDDIKPDDMFFLQYTSGSTGIPKGVVLRHSQAYHQVFAIIPSNMIIGNLKSETIVVSRRRY